MNREGQCICGLKLTHLFPERMLKIKEFQDRIENIEKTLIASDGKTEKTILLKKKMNKFFYFKKKKGNNIIMANLHEGNEMKIEKGRI